MTCVRASSQPHGRPLSAAHLRRMYSRVVPSGTPVTMRRDLRAWLRRHESVTPAALDRFMSRRGRGLEVTLGALAADPASEDLLAPELLLALQALDSDPDELREHWPSDPHELETLADAFGRPFTC
jgi:hypothetical protein